MQSNHSLWGFTHKHRYQVIIYSCKPGFTLPISRSRVDVVDRAMMRYPLGVHFQEIKLKDNKIIYVTLKSGNQLFVYF